VTQRERLADVAEFIRDGTHGSPPRTETGVPVLSAMNVKGGLLNFETDRYTSDAEFKAFNRRLPLASGDVLLTIVGTIGRAAVVGDVSPLVFQRSVAVVRPRTDRLSSRFLYHVTQSAGFQTQLDRAANKSSQAGVYLGKLGDVEIPLPPLPEQRRIAGILDQADALRAKRREALAQLESLTQSIFIEMFGEPGNPKRWELVSLPEATDFQEGPGIMAKDFRQSGVPLVRLAGLNGTDVSLRGCNFVDPDMFARKWAHFALNEGDILVLTSASFGNPAVVGKEAVGAIFYTGIVRFKPRRGDLDAVYLRHFLGSTWFMRQATALASGAVIKHFGPTHLKLMTIPIPPLHLQRQFTERAAQVEVLRGPSNQAMDESQRLFASLQHRAFAGQLS